MKIHFLLIGLLLFLPIILINSAFADSPDCKELDVNYLKDELSRLPDVSNEILDDSVKANFDRDLEHILDDLELNRDISKKAMEHHLAMIYCFPAYKQGWALGTQVAEIIDNNQAELWRIYDTKKLEESGLMSVLIIGGAIGVTGAMVVTVIFVRTKSK